MSEEYVLQITYQGIDDKGRTVMLNIRGTNAKQFDDMLTHATPLIAGLRPLPQKSYGGAGQSKRDIVYLPDAPKCPKHGNPLNVREWTSPEGKVLHFWSCGTKDANGFCREKVKPDPTPEQVSKWRELNGIEAPVKADDTTFCKMHQVKMTEVSQKSGKSFHRLTLEDGTPGFCDGRLVSAGKHANQAQA